MVRMRLLKWFGSSSMGRIDGNKAIIADNDIIGTAVAAVSSKLLLPPLMPRLSTTLKGDCPFPVFAPTDEAFSLPQGVVVARSAARQSALPSLVASQSLRASLIAFEEAAVSAASAPYADG